MMDELLKGLARLVRRQATLTDAERVLRDVGLGELLEAAEQAQWSCTIRQRDSGHLIECWKVDWVIALERVRAALAGAEKGRAAK